MKIFEDYYKEKFKFEVFKFCEVKVEKFEGMVVVKKIEEDYVVVSGGKKECICECK